MDALCDLLSRALLVEVDAATLEILRSEPVVSVLDEVEPDVRAFLLKAVELEDLAAEYASLFLLKDGITPLRRGLLAGQQERLGDGLQTQLHSVRRYLEVDLGPQSPRTPIDHIGCVLALFAEAARRNATTVARSLADQVLIPVLPLFGAAVVRLAESPYYRALGRLCLSLPDFIGPTQSVSERIS